MKVKQNKSKDCDLIIFNKIRSKIKNIKRIFFLISKNNCIRGKHAHKKCSQLFCLVSGMVILKIHDRKKNIKKIKLNSPKNYFLLKPNNWLEIELKKNSKLMVICDYDYDEKDYIRKYDNFLNIKKK